MHFAGRGIADVDGVASHVSDLAEAAEGQPWAEAHETRNPLSGGHAGHENQHRDSSWAQDLVQAGGEGLQ